MPETHQTATPRPETLRPETPRPGVPRPGTPLTDMPRTGALTDIRVVDLSRVLAGPLCGQMLADHGADVIKVEPPGGDETRGWGPPFVRDDHSAYFDGLNRNKRNICIDLRDQEGQALLGRMLEGADVVIENFRAGTLEKWGFGDDELAERFPRLIHCRITGYGVDGPLGGARGTTPSCRDSRA